MACQLPVVATDVGGIGCVIEDGRNGFIIPPKSDTHLAEPVITLLQDSALRERLSTNARNTDLPDISGQLIKPHSFSHTHPC